MAQSEWREEWRFAQDMERGESLMDEKKSAKNEPIPGRMEVLRDLPADIMRRLSKDEVKAFLFEEVWPDSLSEKLKEYLE
jgi:hypothetical protein